MFSRSLKRRVGIWLAGNLRVEVVADCLYSPSCREGELLGNPDPSSLQSF